MSMVDVVDHGDELEILKEARRTVAAQMDACTNGHDLSALADKVMRISERIGELERSRDKRKQTALDEVRKVRK